MSKKKYGSNYSTKSIFLFFKDNNFLLAFIVKKKEKKINRYIKVAKPYTILNNGKVMSNLTVFYYNKN